MGNLRAGLWGIVWLPPVCLGIGVRLLLVNRVMEEELNMEEESKDKRDPAGQAPLYIAVTMCDYNSFQRVVAIALRRPPFCLLNLTQVPLGQLKPTTVEEEDFGNQLPLNQVNIVQTTTVRLLLLAVVTL